jgi:hypothetical protein
VNNSNLKGNEMGGPNGQSSATCKFYYQPDPEGGDAKRRRKSPLFRTLPDGRPNLKFPPFFPVTGIYGWCGEHSGQK